MRDERLQDRLDREALVDEVGSGTLTEEYDPCLHLGGKLAQFRGVETLFAEWDDDEADAHDFAASVIE